MLSFIWYKNIYKYLFLKQQARIIWTYNFDETSIDNVLEDLVWIDELSDDVISDIREAFRTEIIWKLPYGFCVRRVDAFQDTVELYTFY